MQSFKLKLILAFTIMTLFGSLICGSLLYYNFLNYSDDSVRDRLAAAVYSAESALDYSGVGDLLEPGAYKTDYYNEAINKLSRLNANLGTEYLYSIMKDSAGKFVFTLDSGSVDDPVEDDSYLSEVEDWPSLYTAWDSGELVIDKEYYSDEWGTFLSACLPLLNEGGEVFAVIGADISAEELEGAKKSILITFLIALLTAVILSSIFAVVVAFRIVRPINSMADALTDIASGQGDLRRRLDRISNDEIGVMVDNYNDFVETMSEIISRILKSERELNAGGEELSTGMAQTSSALSQIGSNIANVKQQLQIQQDRFEQLFTALGGNGRSINGLNSSIEQQY